MPRAATCVVIDEYCRESREVPWDEQFVIESLQGCPDFTHPSDASFAAIGAPVCQGGTAP